MFAYTDPTGTGALAAEGALQNYREKVGFFDQRFHNVDASGYTLREAFNELAPGTQGRIATVRCHCSRNCFRHERWNLM